MATKRGSKPPASAYTGEQTDLPNPNPGYTPAYYDNRGTQTQRPDYDRPPNPNNPTPPTPTPSPTPETTQSNAVTYAIYAGIAIIAIYLVYSITK